MNTELFGVFGDEATFSRFREPSSFDCVVEGDSITVGVRDVGFGIPGRTDVHAGEEGLCVLWGEAYLPESTTTPAKRVLERAGVAGPDVLADVNGSHLAVVESNSATVSDASSESGDSAYVATDQARTWDCFYTDAPGVRVFGSDAFEVARTIPEPTVRRDSLLEFLHLGVVLGEATLLDELRRVPFDGRLHADRTETFDRFVYDRTEFEYVEQLARRLERALERRARLPGRKGALLSAGYDSRVLLAGAPDVDAGYTVTRQDGREADVAGKIADQYDSDHAAFEADGDYLNTDFETVQYANGIRESIHIHQGGYADRMDADAMYHGLLFDTFLRGHFLPRDSVEVAGYSLPRERLATEFDPARRLVTDKFGFVSLTDHAADLDGVDFGVGVESEEFARDAVAREFDRLDWRYDSQLDGCAAVGIANQPTHSFRTHLANHFLEAFPAADAELLDWHLRTPPEYRTTETFRKALERIDGDILRHRPPDRPHDSHTLNQIEQFVRARTPLLSDFENAWPSRREEYARANLDEELFPDRPELHDLPVRLKLRINDAQTWLGELASVSDPEVGAILAPPEERFRLGSV
jgi:asparagine synthase (glutamine-hydrolysing)